jgi:XTP/dITP diphosphohydrolase|tara:strand:+ start:658 stop:1263 length:606 start_codon:yes stop_codon:yes gene_type:complete
MKKIEKILVGTHNEGKFKEISFLLSKKIKKISPNFFKIKSPKETGKSFFENSRLKANYFHKKSGLTSISDDSGLVVKCLNGKPGIYSARWANKYGNFKKAMEKIIKLVELKNKNKTKKDKRAEFVCSLSYKCLKKKMITVEGRIKGNISNKIVGTNGFGYDPIFIPLKKKTTFGQMNKKSKMKMDHRFIAFSKLRKRIKTL